MTKSGQTIRLKPHDAPACGAAPGELVGGRFRLHSVVGHGGQAVVFSAADLGRAGASVAVKVARRDASATERAEAEAVLRWEGGLLRRLRHPALPRLYRLERSPRATWFARDMVPGESLLALSRRGPQPQQRVLSWALQLCDLLTYLHTQEVPIVVGDLKPANLVLRPDGTLALIDLGAAQTLTRRPPRTPRPRHGTPGYAPPEQLGNWGHDERADVFALAVTCYELLTGLDPTSAPLQFDVVQLERVAPRLAPALRQALDLDPDRRCPTAAVLRSQLGAPMPLRPLLLGLGVALNTRRDLDAVVQRASRLIEPAVSNGALERWLATHPDATMGSLRYVLRATQRAAPRRPALDTLLIALAPAEGSALLRFDPPRLLLGDVPLKRWRIWGRPQPLLLHNTAMAPLRWELTSPARNDAHLRILLSGKPQRQSTGVLAPGQQVRLDLVAMAAPGPHCGELMLRCGHHAWVIPWEATGRAGVPVGARHVARLEELDLERPDLVPALEQLLAQGTLARWLRITGRRPLAAEVDALLARSPSELERRLLIGRILSTLAPERYPSLRIRGLELATAHTLTAGEPSYLTLDIDNLGSHPCPLVWQSHTPWAVIATSPAALGPGERTYISLRLHPPRSLRGPQPVALELVAGALPLNIIVPTQVNEGFWQRLKRLFGG